MHVHYVTLKMAEGRTAKVNPLHVGAVYPRPDRPERFVVSVGGIEHRVIGTEAEILAALGWTELSPPAPAGAAPPTPESSAGAVGDDAQPSGESGQVAWE